MLRFLGFLVDSFTGRIVTKENEALEHHLPAQQPITDAIDPSALRNILSDIPPLKSRSLIWKLTLRSFTSTQSI